MVWRIDYTDAARKQLRGMDRRAAKRIVDYMDRQVATLADPRQAGKPLKGRLAELWRYRVGDYRVVCSVRDDSLAVLVVRVGHRSAVYR